MTEQAAEHFSKKVKELDEEHELFRVNDAIKSVLEEFSQKLQGEKVLDIGCGTGKDTEFLEKQGFNVTGIDLSEEMISYCKQNRSGQFIKKDIRDIDFEEDTFDGIWCSAAIFFIPEEDMRKVVSEFREIIKPQGLLYINFKQVQGEESDVSKKEQIQHTVAKDEAQSILEENGFKIDKFTESSSEGGSVFLNFFARPKEF